MAEIGGDTLRALIRLIPPARTLRDDLEKSIHLEHYDGTGDVAVRSFRTLQRSVSQVIDDPYVAALCAELPDDATDKEKVWEAFLAAGQLLEYLGARAGFVSRDRGSVDYRMQIPIGNMNVKDAASAASVVEGIFKAVKGKGEAEEPKEEEQGEGAKE